MNAVTWVAPALVALTLASGACAPPADQETGSVTEEELLQAREGLHPESLAHLDSGSVAFRARDLEEALRHYQMVVEQSPEAPAGWFGVYMTQQALGNSASADSALARVRSLAPGASLVRDTAGGRP